MKKITFSMIAVISIFTIAKAAISLENQNNNKFIGEETTCGEEQPLANGRCAKYCTTTLYFFWLPVQSSSSVQEVACKTPTLTPEPDTNLN